MRKSDLNLDRHDVFQQIIPENRALVREGESTGICPHGGIAVDITTYCINCMSRENFKNLSKLVK